MVCLLPCCPPPLFSLYLCLHSVNLSYFLFCMSVWGCGFKVMISWTVPSCSSPDRLIEHILHANSQPCLSSSSSFLPVHSVVITSEPKLTFVITSCLFDWIFFLFICLKTINFKQASKEACSSGWLTSTCYGWSTCCKWSITVFTAAAK